MTTTSLDARSLGASLSPGQPFLRFALAIRADLGPALEFDTAHGTRRAMFPITGGEYAFVARILGKAANTDGRPSGSSRETISPSGL